MSEKKELWKQFLAAKKGRKIFRLRKILLQFKDIQEHRGVAFCLKNIGAYYYKNGKLKDAAKYYKEALESQYLNDAENKKKSIVLEKSVILYTLSLLEYKIGNFESSEKYLKTLRDNQVFFKTIKTIQEKQKPNESSVPPQFIFTSRPDNAPDDDIFELSDDDQDMKKMNDFEEPPSEPEKNESVDEEDKEFLEKEKELEREEKELEREERELQRKEKEIAQAKLLFTLSDEESDEEKESDEKKMDDVEEFSKQYDDDEEDGELFKDESKVEIEKPEVEQPEDVEEPEVEQPEDVEEPEVEQPEDIEEPGEKVQESEEDDNEEEGEDKNDEESDEEKDEEEKEDEKKDEKEDEDDEAVSDDNEPDDVDDDEIFSDLEKHRKKKEMEKKMREKEQIEEDDEDDSDDQEIRIKKKKKKKKRKIVEESESDSASDEEVRRKIKKKKKKKKKKRRKKMSSSEDDVESDELFNDFDSDREGSESEDDLFGEFDDKDSESEDELFKYRKKLKHRKKKKLELPKSDSNSDSDYMEQADKRITELERRKRRIVKTKARIRRNSKNYTLKNYLELNKMVDEVIELEEDEESTVENLTLKSRVLNNIGSIYYQNEKYDQALKFFRKAIKIKLQLDDYDNLFIPLNNVGKIHFLKKEFEHALKYFDKALKYNTKSTRILENLSLTHLKLRSYKRCKFYLKKYLLYERSDEKLRFIYKKLGLCYYREGDLETALSHYKKCLKYCKTEEERDVIDKNIVIIQNKMEAMLL